MKLRDFQISELSPHPRNYRHHPDDQIAELRTSIREFGMVRNIVVSSDNVIIIGHGVTQAAREEGLKTIPGYQMDFAHDDPRALKLLVAENELWRRAEDDDRLLTDLLRELNESEVGIEGTGYTEQMIANLVFVTRTDAEIPDFDAAREWVGMPDIQEEKRLEEEAGRVRLIVWFDSAEARQEFMDEHGMKNIGPGRSSLVMSTTWPPKPQRRLSDYEFADGDEE